MVRVCGMGKRNNPFGILHVHKGKLGGVPLQRYPGFDIFYLFFYLFCLASSNKSFH